MELLGIQRQLITDPEKMHNILLCMVILLIATAIILLLLLPIRDIRILHRMIISAPKTPPELIPNTIRRFENVFDLQ